MNYITLKVVPPCEYCETAARVHAMTDDGKEHAMCLSHAAWMQKKNPTIAVYIQEGTPQAARAREGKAPYAND